MFKLLFIAKLVFFNSLLAQACKCVNADINALYEQADLVAVGSFSGEFKNNKRAINVAELIKGKNPSSGAFIINEASSCGAPLLPVSNKSEFLFFAVNSGSDFKLITRCHLYENETNFFNLRMNENSVDVSRIMISDFLKSKGEIPKVELVFSTQNNPNGIENALSIINKSNKEISIFHPSNRKAFTFFAVDNRGNPVPPMGNAKVDPMGGILKIPAKGSFNYKILPNSKLYWPFLSDTAQFGYELKTKTQYKVHVIYRPYGGSYGAIYSEEKRLNSF
jgi:hypothetical protein